LLEKNDRKNTTFHQQTTTTSPAKTTLKDTFFTNTPAKTQKSAK